MVYVICFNASAYCRIMWAFRFRFKFYNWFSSSGSIYSTFAPSFSFSLRAVEGKLDEVADKVSDLFSAICLPWSSFIDLILLIMK